MDKPPKPPESNTASPGSGAAIAFGTQFAAGMAFFTAIGWWIDHRRAEGSQAFTLAGIFLGLFYGGYELWKLIRAIQAADTKPKDSGTK